MQEQNANTVSYLFKIPNYIGELARMPVNSHCARMWAAKYDPMNTKIFSTL